MLYLRGIIGDTIWGVWRVNETAEELFMQLHRKEWLEKIDDVQSASRRLEMLATRVLLKDLSGEEKEICYLPSGKPFLSDNSFHISISHTVGYVAIVLNPKHTMGLDIEQRTDKIFRVRDRVITRYDFIDPQFEQIHLLLHWSAKEAMFKYLNSSGVDFRRNLHVEPFSPKVRGVFRVSESKTNRRQKFDAYYIVDSDFVLVTLVSMSI